MDIAEQSVRVMSTSVCGGEPIHGNKHPILALESKRRHSILCVSGQVELEMEGQNYLLNPGDSLEFDSDAFHRWRNSEETTGIAVFVLPPHP